MSTPSETSTRRALLLAEALVAEQDHLEGTTSPREHLEERRRELEAELAGIADEDERRRRVDSALVGELYRGMHEQGVERSALCISGGGIRSATFALGMIQGLARHGLLRGFDYLSTVSGGGYVGSWLTAWIHRESAKTGAGVERVEAQLASQPTTPLRPEPEPVCHLRSYSRYMSPRLGLLSADTWSLVGIFLRNLFLNWLVLLPLLAAALMIPRFGVRLVRATPPPEAAWISLGVGFLLGVLATAYIAANRPSLLTAGDSRFPERLQRQDAFLLLCLLPLVLMALALALFWAWRDPATGPPQALPEWATRGSAAGAFAGFGALLNLAGFALSRWWVRRWTRATFPELLIVAATGALGGLGAWFVALRVFPPFGGLQNHALYTCFAASLLLGIFLLAATFFVGLSSRFTGDDDREWFARCGAWVLIAMLVLSAGTALVIFGPSLLVYFGAKWLSVIGGASGLVTLLLGKSAKTKAMSEAGTGKGSKASAASNLVLSLAAPLFTVFLLIVLALGTSYLLTGPFRFAWPVNDQGASGFTWPKHGQLSYDPPGFIDLLTVSPFRALAAVFGSLLLLGVFMGRFVDINRFSLHGAYRDRLIRAYLGASRPLAERKPNPLTGFDSRDNVLMRDLRHRRPFHVVNTALNLVAGKNLAWQDRKAESFTVSPLHAGSFPIGYRDTQDYGLHWEPGTPREQRKAISLGTALAISGAAASPNMGYHSSTFITFLLALFNVRLGWWLGNPGPAGEHTYDTAGPRFAPRALAAELFGKTDDEHPYVYLSDGGHFENLAIYEMVLRRCHYIVVLDGEQDGDFRFAGLGIAVSKIRTDFGIPIEFDPPPPMRPYDPTAPPAAGSPPLPYYALGRIRYSCVDGDAAPDGWLLYVKVSLNGSEPVDVLNYAKTHRAFPHEPTGDQLYSESQFESYRALGSHVAEAILGGLPKGSDLAGVFRHLRGETAQ